MKNILIISLVCILIGGLLVSLTKPFEFIKKVDEEKTVHIDGTDNVWLFEKAINPADANMVVEGFDDYSISDGKLNLYVEESSGSIHFGKDFHYDISSFNEIRISFDLTYSSYYELSFYCKPYCETFEDISEHQTGIEFYDCNFYLGDEPISIPIDSKLHIEFSFDNKGHAIVMVDDELLPSFNTFSDGTVVCFEGFVLGFSSFNMNGISYTIDNVSIEIS